MSEPIDFEMLFLDHLPFLERLLVSTARVLGLRGDDAEEFASWAKERLLDGDYEHLRKWRGQSKFTTYLGAVVVNLGRDFRVKIWGRWRPSSAAIAAGPIAVRLEKLIYRDGWTFAEAAILMRERGETERSDRELAAVLARLPRRERLRERRGAGVDQGERIAQIPSGVDSEQLVKETETERAQASLRGALERAMSGLDVLAQSVIRMHFLQGRSLADVARVLDVPQKPLYRVKDHALRALRREMELAGITWEDVRERFGEAWDPEVDFVSADERSRPPTAIRDGETGGEGENGGIRPPKEVGPSVRSDMRLSESPALPPVIPPAPPLAGTERLDR